MDNSEKNLFDEFPPVPTEAWLEQVKKDLKGKAIETLNWALEEGVDIRPFYRMEDMEPPVIPTLIPVNGKWLISENLEVEESVTGPKRCNAALKNALNAGVEYPVINIDHVIDQKAYRSLVKGVHQEMISIGYSGLFPEADPVGFLKLIISEIGKTNKPPHIFHGSLRLDPIGFFVENGEFYENQAADMENLGQSLRLIEKKLPSYKLIKVNMHLMHDQKSDISQELAVALATGSEYLAQLTERGLSPDQVHSGIAFSLSVGNLYFPQIAKIRALKSLWLKVLEGYDCKNPAGPWVEAVTSTADQTEDQYMNMIRSTTAAMAALLGGADSLLVTPSDKAFGTPDDFSRRIARNVQHILREESHFGKVQNPVDGSYYLEVLTEKLMQKAWSKFQKIEAAGGILAYLV